MSDCGGRGFGLLFKNGQVTGKVESSKMASALIDAVHEMVKEEGINR